MANKLKEWKRGKGTAYLFDCPGCGFSHVFYVGVDGYPSWKFNGDLVKPTFSPSLVCWNDQGANKYRCHLFMRDGKIQFLGDCTHKLKGQTVECPDWEN